MKEGREFTKDEALGYLTQAAELIEAQIKLNDAVPLLFCDIQTKRQIFIFRDEEFYHLVDLFGRVITFEPHSDEYTKGSFTMKLLGKEYLVFCLLDKVGR